jgi:hypothetical protein
LYLPLWSIALMLIIVFGTAGGIILLILSLGGDPPTDSPPVLIVRTAAPTETPDSFPIVPASATIPPEFVPDRTNPENFALAGPTLVTPFMTPTPRPLAVGEAIIVTDVLPDQLNIRDQPGVTTGSFIVFQANEGARFTIVDGPRQADGLTWWRIQDPNNATIVGWAASIYLRVEGE